uniref:Uncharacterized protein n=1 Tax=Oryzias sinensis TaxID=183150 RepID=A0A8C7Z1L5_9TELE
NFDLSTSYKFKLDPSPPNSSGFAGKSILLLVWWFNRFLSSPGIQEYVEAVSFLHYIRHRSLISLEEINARLVYMRAEGGDPKVTFWNSRLPSVP